MKQYFTAANKFYQWKKKECFASSWPGEVDLRRLAESAINEPVGAPYLVIDDELPVGFVEGAAIELTRRFGKLVDYLLNHEAPLLRQLSNMGVLTAERFQNVLADI